MEIRLTWDEYNVLNHRLEVPEAICDALEWDGVDFASGYAREDVEFALAQVSLSHVTLQWDDSDQIQRAIIRDLIEGSTYKAAMSGSSYQQRTAIERITARLAEKIGDALKLDIEFPD